MDGLAALQIAPVARNISREKIACQPIVPAIVKTSLAIGWILLASTIFLSRIHTLQLMPTHLNL